MIKQMKGKDSTKLPASKRPSDTDVFYTSKKYDGNYVQIAIDIHDIVTFYTSGGKPFYLGDIADDFRATFKDVVKPIVIEAEYLYNCLGKLGDRVHSAKLTTYRTNLASGISTPGSDRDIFKVFNIIREGLSRDFSIKLLKSLTPTKSIHIVEHTLLPYTFAVEQASKWAEAGWEGAFLVAPHIYYKEGKRINEAIKIKARAELTAKVFAEEEGEGRLEGLIGALICHTPAGIKFSVGSGLSDNERSQRGDYVDRLVEVEYEQLSATGVPLQPVFKRLKGQL